MDIANLKNNSNNHSITCNSTESASKGNLNHLIESNSTSMPVASIVTDLNEKTFDIILKQIKKENPIIYSDSSDVDDSSEIKTNSIIENTKCIKKKLKCKRRKSLYRCQNNIKDKSNGIDTNICEPSLKTSKNSNLVMKSQIKNMSKNNSHLSNNKKIEKISNMSNVSKISHNCSKDCVWCMKSFVIYDHPNHIGRIRNIEKQNSFLRIEPTLKIDSCLCDRCWKFLEKVYKFQETEKRKGNDISLISSDITGSIDNVIISEVKNLNIPKIKDTNLKINRKKKQQSEICSVHNCSEKPIYIIPKDECIEIKKIFLKFDICKIILIEKINTKLNQMEVPYLYLCEEHLLLVNVITTCQLCCNRLNDNLNPDIWDMYYKWSNFLESNNIPLILLPGMFICEVCQSYMYEKDLSSLNLEFVRNNVEKRKDVCLKVFNPDNINQGLSVISPKSITTMFQFNNSPKFKKVKFTDPLITSTFYVECYIDKYNSNENLNLFPNREKKYNENTNMSSLETSNVELNVNEYSCNPKIECDEFTSEYVNPVMKYESLDIKEEPFESFGSYINHNPRPNTRVVKMMKLLQKNNIKTSDRIDVDKNLLPVHVSNILDNNENKTSEDMIADGNNFIFTGKLDKEVNNEGNIINNDMIIKDNCGLVITDVCSKQSIYDISYDNSEDEFSKDNQITNEKDISVVTAYLNESDQCFHSPTLSTDSVDIKKKLRNVVRQRIINGSVKKQNMSETFKINKFPKCGDNENNSSYKDNPTESISNENINFNDVQELSSCEDDMPSFRINSIYSLDPNYHRPLKIHRTLRKVSDFYNVETHGNTDSKSPMYENEYIVHDNILKKFSKDYQTFDNNKYKTKMNRKKFFPARKRNIKTPKNKFPKLNNLNDDEIMNVIDNIQNSINSDNDNDNDNDNEEVIRFSLTNSYNKMYEELLEKFNNDETSMFMHLMENQRMLFNGELILSDNANTEASNYIMQHLNELHEWYGNPKNTDAHQSYLQHTLALNSQLLVDKESSSDTNDIVNISSPSSVYSNDSTSVINISLDEELDIEDLSNSSSETIDIDDISDTSLSMSDQSDTSTSIMTNDLMSFDEISDIQENNTTETVETDETIASLNFFSSGYQNLAKKNDITLNQETHIQDDVTTTTTFSTSKPITSSKIFNLYNQTIIDKPMYNFQLPTAKKCTSANLSKPVQPSFQIPTAVRSKGTPLMQTNKFPFSQPNLNTNIRHKLNNNQDYITD